MTRKATKKGETLLSDAIRDALAWEPELLLWRNSNGVFRARGFVVHAGLPAGSADLIGVLGVEVEKPAMHVRRGDGCQIVGCDPGCVPASAAKLGRFVALEVKRPGEKAELHQLEWLAKVREVGGFACVVTSVLEGLAAIRRARNGALE